MGIAGCTSIVAFARVVGSIHCPAGALLPKEGSNAAQLLVWWDLVEQVRQHWRVANAAAGDLNGPYLQRFLINSYMYLAPKTTFGPTMLACVPLAFALNFDACAIYQKVQRTG